MQPHTGVQVVVIWLTGHVGHGEVYRCAVGDGHCNRTTGRLALELESQRVSRAASSSQIHVCASRSSSLFWAG